MIEQGDSKVSVAVPLMVERDPEKRDSTSLENNGENEEVTRGLPPEPVGSVKSKNPGSVWQKCRDDFGKGF